MPLPLLFPALATGANLIGQGLNYLLTKPKKPKSLYGERLKMLHDQALGSANEVTANQGVQLGQALTARGLQNSSVGTNTLASLSSQNTQNALSQMAPLRLQALMDDQQRKDAYDQEKRQRVQQLIGGVADTAATNLAGYGAVREQNSQHEQYLKLLRELYGYGV